MQENGGVVMKMSKFDDEDIMMIALYVIAFALVIVMMINVGTGRLSLTIGNYVGMSIIAAIWILNAAFTWYTSKHGKDK